MSGPSDKAVQEGAAMAATAIYDWDAEYRERLARAIGGAMHRPALGLDRSVCLRDAGEVLVGERTADEQLAAWAIEIESILRKRAVRDVVEALLENEKTIGGRAARYFIQREFGEQDDG